LIQDVADAFAQINGNKYQLKFFGDNTINFFLAAVCIAGRTDDMIEFQEVKPFDFTLYLFLRLILGILLCS
jgi:hypothetical protein